MYVEWKLLIEMLDSESFGIPKIKNKILTETPKYDKVSSTLMWKSSLKKSEIKPNSYPHYCSYSMYFVIWLWKSLKY